MKIHFSELLAFGMFRVARRRHAELQVSTFVGMDDGDHAKDKKQTTISKYPVWPILGYNPIPSLIALTTAIAFVLACLFNVGYTMAWDISGILVFTPGDYVTLSIPIFMFVGAFFVVTLILGIPTIILVVIFWLVTILSRVPINEDLAGAITVVIIVLGQAILDQQYSSQNSKKFNIAPHPFPPFGESDNENDDEHEEALSKDLTQEEKPPQKKWVKGLIRLTLIIGLLLCCWVIYQRMLVTSVTEILSTTILFAAFFFAVTWAIWLLLIGLPSRIIMIVLMVTGMSFSAPFAGYSFFASQVTQSINASHACSAGHASKLNSSENQCMLRPLERGVLLMDTQDGSIIYEGHEGYRITYLRPKNLRRSWGQILRR